jgi:23S rRNA pseudouridine1911/1915/1917 synthase
MNAPRLKTTITAGSPPKIIHQDSQLIVINKPSGLSTVPFRPDERDTLEHWASLQLGKQKVRVVQRLDRETSGLIVFARTREAEENLANQFRFHTIHRRYLALAHGKVQDQTIRSALAENRGDGLRGSILPGSAVSRSQAKMAVTHVRAKTYFEGYTWIECELETGRTHQIRIHLSEAGHPLLGEKAYNREFLIESPEQWIEAPRIMLHAAELGFIHPTRQEPMLWKEPVPEDFREFLS